MGEELSDDAQAVGLEAMDSFVIVRKRFLEQVGPHSVQLAESLSNHAVELFVCPFLTGTLHDHRRELVLQAVRQIDSHELVYALLEATTTLDGQVDCSAQVHKISVGLVLDIHCLDLFVFVIFRRGICVTVVIAALLLTQDLCLDPGILVLVLFIFGVYLENVQAILNLQISLQCMVVGNLILLFYKIQLVPYNWVVLVLCAPDLEKNLDHVLRSLVNIRFVEDVAHLVEDGIRDGGFHLVKESTDFLHDSNGNLDGVIGRLVEQKQQNLGDENLVDDLGVDEMRKEHSTR